MAVLRGSLDEALAAYRAAASIAPSRALPHTSLGGVLLRLGHLEEALVAYAAAVARAPHDEGALLGQAEALTMAGGLSNSRRRQNEHGISAACCARSGSLPAIRPPSSCSLAPSACVTSHRAARSTAPELARRGPSVDRTQPRRHRSPPRDPRPTRQGTSSSRSSRSSRSSWRRRRLGSQSGQRPSPFPRGGQSGLDVSSTRADSQSP